MNLPQRINVGITIESNEGYVSEYECREACLYSGYTWPDWYNLDITERATCVAHYRMHMLIEAHVNEAVYKFSEAQSRNAGAGVNGRNR